MAFQFFRAIWITLVIVSPFLSVARGDLDSAKSFTEHFEQGVKGAYASADVVLPSGRWRLDKALIGKSLQDKKEGTAALRIAAGGSALMLFSVELPPTIVRFRHASFGKDRPGSVSLWYSSDQGVSWRMAGPAIKQHYAAATATFKVPEGGRLRFLIRNDGGGRVNIDDFGIGKHHGGEAYTPPSTILNPPVQSTRDDNMALGNPSNAVADPSSRTNYLLTHPQYTLSYNHEKGTANWLSWHLSPAWRGDAPRCDCFFNDSSIPQGLYKAMSSGYIGSGFDRGHLCPSEDRTASNEDNAATFLMTNISPQAPMLNQKPWSRLEAYCRLLTDQGKELYIIAGSHGYGGNGSNGPASSIGGGHIIVPSRYWKIIVVLPIGNNDLQRITSQTRVIAVDMPNTQSAGAQSWGQYLTSVGAIERATGYRFFSRLPKDIRDALRVKNEKNEGMRE